MSSSDSAQWEGKTGGGKVGQRLLIMLFGIVKVSFVYPILIPVIPFYFIFGKKSRRSTYVYFHDILGYSRWESFWMSLKCFMTFGEVVLDKFALAAGNLGQFSVNALGRELFDSALDNPKGCIIAGSHIGNMEICGNALRQDKKKIYALIYGGENAFLQKKRNESLSQVEMIPVKEDMSHSFEMLKALMNGDIFMVACDRLYPGERSLKVNFMGHEAEFPLGMFLIAAKLKIPIFSIVTVKVKRLNYKIIVQKIEADESLPRDKYAEALVKSYVKSLEVVLDEYPYQWFNFFDFWNIQHNN